MNSTPSGEAKRDERRGHYATVLADLDNGNDVYAHCLGAVESIVGAAYNAGDPADRDRHLAEAMGVFDALSDWSDHYCRARRAVRK